MEEKQKQDLPFQIDFEEDTKKSRSRVFLTLIAALVIILLGIGFYYLQDKSTQEANPTPKESTQQESTQPKEDITKLRYIIKPKEYMIAKCDSMQNGKWDIPKECLASLTSQINKELESDKSIVAFEVQGIVDTNPYSGPSPELKQEGLASFRAWNAIREINKKIPNITAFEGPSIQLKDKRGYRIKAYFIE